METWLRFVLASLATWRISFLLGREDGPWDILARLRLSQVKGTLGPLVRCVKCLSLWVAVPFAFFVAADPVERFIAWLALSGAASLIDEATKTPFEWKETTGDEMLRRDSQDHAP